MVADLACGQRWTFGAKRVKPPESSQMLKIVIGMFVASAVGLAAIPAFAEDHDMRHHHRHHHHEMHRHHRHHEMGEHRM